MDPNLLAHLTDALARGHLSISELIGMEMRELDAVYLMAVARLEVDQDSSAMQLFAGLAALFPFCAKYWRGYGIALHRLRLWAQAHHAYDAALQLEPNHALTCLYRAEVLAHLGEYDKALHDIKLAIKSNERSISKRARDLERILKVSSKSSPFFAIDEYDNTIDAENEVTKTNATIFTLRDNRTLPLVDGPLAEAERTHTSVNIMSHNLNEITYADITHADITHADITHADITHANITHADITHANITQTNVASLEITNSDITQTNMVTNNTTPTNITNTDIVQTNIADTVHSCSKNYNSLNTEIRENTKACLQSPDRVQEFPLRYEGFAHSSRNRRRVCDTSRISRASTNTAVEKGISGDGRILKTRPDTDDDNSPREITHTAITRRAIGLEIEEDDGDLA
ncbi:MAG: pentapeptide repeat-containing protein [Deltaproteobacteria bacterium]|nr:pentapeptide repeat-containing protein [Deltaproteobacteria bacterium]